MEKIDVKSFIKDTSENWTKSNPVMIKGNIAYETDTDKMKVFDGIHKFNDLNYVNSAGSTPSGQTDYSSLVNKPKINNVELNGNKSLEELGVIIPTKLSELENDEDFITANDIPSDFVKQDQLTDYALKSDVETTYATKDELVSTLNEKANSADVYTKEEVDGKISSVFHYKGSVASFDNLPKNAEKGDVYNVEDTGANYAWSGTEWDKLSETVDLSAYLTKESAENTYETKENVANELAKKASKDIEQTVASNSAEIATIKETVAKKADSETMTNELNKKANQSDLTATDNKVSSIENKFTTIETKITFDVDVEPTESSRNLMTSDGIYHALEKKVDTSVVETLATVESVNNVKGELSKYQEKATTISGYNISDAYTKDEINNLLADKAGVASLDSYALKTDLDKKQDSLSAIQLNAINSGITDEKVSDYDGYAEEIADNKELVNASLNKVKVVEDKILPIESSISKIDATTVAIISRMNTLEEKLAEVKKTAVEEKEVQADGQPITLNDSTKDFVVSGNIDEKLSVTEAKSVEVKGLTSTADKARLALVANDEITLKDVSLDAEYKKATANAVITTKESNYVTIKDLTFTESASCYNCIEVGLNGETLPKNVLIDSCTFKGNLSNVAILVFGTQDNAVININNCKFETVSNMLRLSNRTNAKNVVVNITNCDINKWDSDPQWVGGIIMQDYTSKTVEDYMNNNLFGDDKITINIVNCTHAGQKIVAGDPIEQFGSTNVEKQVAFIWSEVDEKAYNTTGGSEGHKLGIMPYDASRYPTINIM